MIDLRVGRRMVAAWPELSATWRGKKRQEVYLQLLTLRGH